MNDILDENNIRKEFSEWINEVANELQREKGNKDSIRKYYVYALCEQADDGSIIPFYIGKGMEDRVWQHADETEKEKELIKEEAKKYKLSEQEIKQLYETLTEKQQKISAIGNHKLKRIIIKSGLTEYESFMCESALINFLRLKDISYSSANNLTNKQNGHSSPFEKKAEIKSSALLVEDYYKNYCKEPVIYNSMSDKQLKDFSDRKIMLRNINNTYPQCINPDIFPTDEEKDRAIMEAVRGFWVEGDLQRMDYVFAMFEGRIKGVYKVMNNGEKDLPHIYDLWRDDYPIFDKLSIRKDEYQFAKKIYDDLVSQNIIVLQNGRPAKGLTTSERGSLYTLLSEEVKEEIKKDINDSIHESVYKDWLKEQRKKEPTMLDNETTRERFYNDYLRRWSLRKYYNLANIDEGDGPNFKEYINCSIKISRDNSYESIFSRKKTQRPDGTYFRPFPASIIYLPPTR